MEGIGMQEDCFLQNWCNHLDCDKEFCARRYKMEAIYDLSLIPPKRRERMKLYTDADGTDLEEFKLLSSIEKSIESFVDSGQNLYLHSKMCGNGKTSWALRLAGDYINKIWPSSEICCRVLFVNVPNFLLDLKSNISRPVESVNYIRDSVKTADLVIWDDIASKVGSDYEINNLLGLIEARTSSGKANIYTSNLTRAELEASLGSRIASRVCGLSVDVELHGADKRATSVEAKKC